LLQADDTGHGTHVDDVAGTLLAHDRQRCPHHVQHAPEVGRELAFDVLRIEFLEVAEQAVAGIVQDDIDAAERLHCLIDYRRDGGLIGDVQLKNLQVLARRVAQGMAHFLYVPASGDNAIAGLPRRLGSAGTDTAACTGDEPDFVHAGTPLGLLSIAMSVVAWTEKKNAETLNTL